MHKHLNINMLMKIIYTYAFHLFLPCSALYIIRENLMTVRGIAAMKKDFDIEVQDIMKVWDY